MSGIGTQFDVPDGFLCIPMGTRVYFVSSDTHTGRVQLCWFVKHGCQWRAHLVCLEQQRFEEAVLFDPPRLKRAEVQHSLPPWLLEVEGTNFDEIEDCRINPKQTYRQAVSARHSDIADLVDSSADILATSDPLAEISRRGRRINKNKHPHRLQAWFFAYLLHGRNIWSLMAATHNIGLWKRDSPTHSKTKFGRRGYKTGKTYGNSIHEMRKLVEAGYLAHCGLKRTMKWIHRQALVTHFGCKVMKLQQGGHQIIQPKGGPFPSYGQFRRAIIEKFGTEGVQKTRWGAARHRSKMAPGLGSFSAPYANLLESLIVDAFYIKERPHDLLSDDANERLCVFRGICGTSANRCGIGFSLKSEKRRGYQEMLFCMAIPKEEYGRIIGVPIEHEEWPSVGLPPAYASDRGPGASDKIIADLEMRFPVRELAPSHSGQSKALVESTHSRDDHTEGEPVHVVSHLDTIQMMRQQVLLTKAENHRSNISPRLTPQMVVDFDKQGLMPTPFHLWNYLDERYRTNAVSTSFEQAVRTFLQPIQMTAQSDGIWIHGERYDSAALRSTGLLGKVARNQSIKVTGYMLTIAVRYAWIEIEGRLVEVAAELLLRDDKSQLFSTYAQLEARGLARKRLNANHKEHADAAIVSVIDEFRECTGKAWLGGRVKAGRVKKPSGAGAVEAAQRRARSAEGAA